MDEVLEKLGALQIAHDSLSESDRQWLAATLRAELKKLGNEKKFESLIIGDHNISVQGDNNAVTVNNGTTVTNLGSGAIAFNGGIAAGQSGVAVGGNVGAIYMSGATPAKTVDLHQALRRYLDNIIDTHQHLKLAGIRSGGQALSVDLEKVYVSLKALDKRPRSMDEKIDRAEWGRWSTAISPSPLR